MFSAIQRMTLANAGIAKRFENASKFDPNGSNTTALGRAFSFDAKKASIGQVGIKKMRIKLRGDSITALTWAGKLRTKGDSVINAAVIFTIMAVTWNVEITDTEYITSKDNYGPDRLSRNPLTDTMATLGHLDVIHVDLNNDPAVAEILRLCNPKTDLGSEQGFRAFWRDAHTVIASL